MDVISKAGLAWLYHHGLTIDRLQYQSVRGPGNTWWLSRPRIDDDYSQWHHEPIPHDVITLRNDFWLLTHTFGGIRYAEQATSRATLRIPGETVPDTISAAVRSRPVPLDQLVSLPQACYARDTDAQVIRADNERGALKLLMRVNWVSTQTAWYAERMRW